MASAAQSRCVSESCCLAIVVHVNQHLPSESEEHFITFHLSRLNYRCQVDPSLNYSPLRLLALYLGPPRRLSSPSILRVP